MTANYPAPVIDELEDIAIPSKKDSFLKIYSRLLLRKAWLIAGITILTTTAATFVAFLKPSTYKGNFYLLVEPITAAAKLTNPTTIARTEGMPREDLISLDYPTNLVFLQSPGMTYRIAQDVYKKRPQRTVAAIWSDLRENFKVEWVRPGTIGSTKIFEVSYEGQDPQEVQAVLDIAAQTFLKYSTEDRETSIKAGVKFIDKQVPPLQRQLNSLKTQEKKIRQQYQLVDPSTKNETLLEEINGIAKQRLDLEQQLLSQQTLSQTLQRQLGISAQYALVLAALNQDPERAILQKQVMDLQSQLINTQALFTSESINVQSLQERYNEVRGLLEQRTQELLKQFPNTIPANSPLLSNFQDPTRLKLIEQLVDATNQIKALQSQLPAIIAKQEKLVGEAEKLPTLINQYTTLQRNIKLTEEVLDRLLLQRESLKVESAQELPWQLISKPQIPLDKDGKPMGDPPSRQKWLLAGFGGGLVFSILLAWLWEKQRNVFFSTADMEDILGLPLLGKVPQYFNSNLSKFSLLAASKSGNLENIIEQEKVNEKQAIAPLRDNCLPFVEVFDDIYTELSFYYRNPPLRSVVISSVQSGDGQSTVALNLAITAAEQGKRVLLVDANSHQSKLRDWLNLESYKGLNYLLAHQEKPESVIQEDPNHKNLFLIASGSEDLIPPKHLWSPRMESLMADFHEMFDLVIYDLPHFYSSTDIYFISACTDGMLLVVGLKKTSQSLVKNALKKANDLRLPILGIIANFV